ncbi:MAG: hypothetical protein KGJ32_09530 [Xanthomonadaceae bacterium]|nr:hypothetical protein [Xanthomonadaceae bacterium]
MSQVISPGKVAAALAEYWSPRVIGEVDDAYVKVARSLSDFGWSGCESVCAVHISAAS